MLLNIPASLKLFVLALLEATLKNTDLLAEIAILSDPSLNIPVFVSFVKRIDGVVALPSEKKDAPVSTLPKFRFAAIPTPSHTSKAPVAVLVDGVVVLVDMIVLAFPTVSR